MGEAKILKLPFADKLVDLISGMGGARDRTVTTSYGALVLIPPTQLQTMYRSDWVARKIVDIVPQDMTREGRRWKAKKEQITAIEAVEKLPSVNLWPKINEALTRARLHGGAAIFIGVEGQDAATPLDPSSVRKGQLRYLNVVYKDELSYDEIDRDPRSPTYGSPKMWRLRGGTDNVQIHPSRLVRFVGARRLETQPGGQDEVWGDSVLQIVHDAVLHASMAQQHVAGLVPDSRTDVIYVPGLGAILQDPTQSKALTERFALARTMKSSYNMLLLEGTGMDGDHGERWEQRTTSFAQLPEILQKYLEIAAGAADIPITRFLGQSPGGENSTGEADMRNYYDHVRALQNLALGPGMAPIDECVIRSALGDRPPEVFYEWAPLWAVTETEKAEILQKTADSARKLAGNANEMPLVNLFALSDGLTNAIVEANLLPGLEAAVDEHGDLSKTLAADALDPTKREQKKAEAAARQAEFRAANQNRPPQAAKTGTSDAAPRTMYVRRQLLNVAEFVKWASDAGFENILSSDQLHVTVMFSKTPVDWISMGEDWWGDSTGKLTVQAGGPRVVERLGPTATVLTFYSRALRARHMQMLEAGAVSDYEDYVAHVTISHRPQNIDVEKVLPYRGALRFGPEIFEEIDPNWKDKV